ncbi:Gfo/Idh/MocA family protein [Noviherbaspirillum aridicola]|uniref:Inositol 2-dehydrogenase n=1 Tax=Noviherbaspirillum aridicola TaxID=2849687 RepID=A0ABQ4Q3B9_9BURK|nr:Gfo/Idh/MocA family oxidoreductase [Noviherbaspirillum aridicola]GIZ51295.1 inositol 2-dehydrogenase [Noviherbaspirillum aridicola]
MAEQTPLQVLIVGCGNIAGGFDASRPADAAPLTHAGAYSRHPGFRLAACVEPDGERRQTFAGRWNVPEGHADLDALAHRAGEFGVISICSPTPCHAAQLEAALRLRPRAIFCEKPVTTTLEQTEYWVNACDEAGVLLAVNHTRRWDPEVVRLKQALRAGELGPLRSIVGHYNKGILNNGGHMVDLLMYLVGPMALLTTASLAHDFWPDDPTIAALLRTADGIPVYLNPADARDFAFFELEIVTATGILRMEDGGMQWRERKAIDSPHFRGYRALDGGARRDGGYPGAMTSAVSNLYDALRSGADLASSGRSALEAQRLCAAIRDAAVRSHTEVNK